MASGTEISGPLSYVVQRDDGVAVRRHVDHILRGISQSKETRYHLLDVPVPDLITSTESTPAPQPSPAGDPPVRRSTRVTKPPDRFGQ